jgi:NADH-quinone oxidoreductase subunit L
MNNQVQYLWMIPLLPLLGFLINGVVGLLANRLKGVKPNRYFVTFIACGLVFVALLTSIAAVWQLAQRPAEERLIQQTAFVWMAGAEGPTTGYGHGAIPAGIARFIVEWGFQLDPLSAVMMLVVTGVGFLIHVFAVGYMWDDPGTTGSSVT